MALFHKDIFLPQVTLPTGNFRMFYSFHALRAAENDRYGHIELPEFVDFSEYEIVEIEILNGRMTKILIRGTLDNKRDICLAIAAGGRVKTVWANLKTDKHRTLDATKYTKETLI